MKIGLIRLSALGDIIHTAASLQFLHAALPEAQVTWFVEEKFAAILEGHPQIEQIVPLDLHGLKKRPSLALLQETFQRIRSAGPFEKVVDMQGLLKSAMVARIAGSPVSGLDRNSAREALSTLFYHDRYRVDCAGIAPLRFASLLSQALGITITEEEMLKKKPCLHLNPAPARRLLEPFYSKDLPNILLIVGTSAAHKNYPREKWIEVVKELPQSNILLVAGSKQERSTARDIAKSTHAKLLPSMDLNALKYAVKRCDLLLGGDTGPSHIAWAMNRPSVVLFGATPSTMMMQTPRNIAISSDPPTHPCRFDRHDRSIATIAPHRIVQASKKILADTNQVSKML